MALWLVVLIGPLIAIGIVVGLVKAAQAVLSSDRLFSVLTSRRMAIVVIAVTALVGVVAVLGFVQLWALTPWGAILLLVIVLANGSVMWGMWFRRHSDETAELLDRPSEGRGGDLAP